MLQLEEAFIKALKASPEFIFYFALFSFVIWGQNFHKQNIMNYCSNRPVCSYRIYHTLLFPISFYLVPCSFFHDLSKLKIKTKNIIYLNHQMFAVQWCFLWICCCNNTLIPVDAWSGICKIPAAGWVFFPISCVGCSLLVSMETKRGVENPESSLWSLSLSSCHHCFPILNQTHLPCVLTLLRGTHSLVYIALKEVKKLYVLFQNGIYPDKYS